MPDPPECFICCDVTPPLASLGCGCRGTSERVAHRACIAREFDARGTIRMKPSGDGAGWCVEAAECVCPMCDQAYTGELQGAMMERAREALRMPVSVTHNINLQCDGRGKVIALVCIALTIAVMALVIHSLAA